MAPASYCHIPHCHNTKYHFAFFKFPNNPELREKWKEVCKMKDATPHMYACEKHFRSWDFTSDKKGKKKLKRGVIPTFIPDPNMPRKGKWWAPERKSNWLKSSEVTVVTMLEEDAEGDDDSKLRSQGKFKSTDIVSPGKVLQHQYLSNLNPSEIKVVVGQSPDEKNNKDSATNWLQNTSIFKLDSSDPSTSTEVSNESILSNETASHNERILTEVNQGVKKVNLPTPQSYAVTIDSSGKIHMAKPAYSSNVIDSRRNKAQMNLNAEKMMTPNKNCIKEVKPIDGENPAPYTVIINHEGMLDTIKTESNIKVPPQPRNPKTGQLQLGKWPETDSDNPVAIHKSQLSITKGQLGHIYRQWVSGKFNDSEEAGNEQFNIMFSLFHNLMDTFKEVEKQNKVLQATLKKKQKPENNFSQKEKKSIIKETLQPYFGQDQIDIILQHQTKRVKDWSKDAIFQAEILRRCMSRSSYRKLRESKIFPLPSLAALKTHLEKFGGLPDIPNVSSWRDNIGIESKTDLNKEFGVENVQVSSANKPKNRRQLIKDSRRPNVQHMTSMTMTSDSLHPVAPDSTSTTEEIMMVPVVNASHIPSSHHEVVLAVDSIMQ